MDKWTRIRRDILVDEMSRREACRKHNLNFRTIQKILEHPEPPDHPKEYARDKPKIGPFLAVIHEILESDKKVHPKQRHTGKRIFERLRDEYGYTGKITVVRDEIRRYKQAKAEVFMPLSHPPGEAQFDFGEAKAIYRGRKIKVMFCVTSLPYSDAFFCQAFPRECTETFQEGHVRAFQFFAVLRRRLESEGGSDGRREFIKILRLLEKHKLRELADAIDRALTIGAMTVDVVRILLQEGRESPAKIFRLDGRPHLQDHNIPEPRISQYGDLVQHQEKQS